MQVQSLSDMARVVISKEDFSLDKAVLSRADESAALFASSPVWTPPPILDEAHQPLPTEFGRAAIYGAIASLSQGRAGVRSVVLQMLVQMLELEVIPCFSAASKIGIELAAVLSGINTTCYYYALIMNSDAVFLSSGLEKLTLTEHEAEVLIKGHFYYTGMAALLAYSAQATMNMVDVVAGVSCEAVNASSEPFSASNYEIHRPHRGMMSSAGNLRLMVEGSKRVTPAATHPEPCFVSIPNFHGPAAELVNAAIKSLIVELNSTDAPPDPRWSHHQKDGNEDALHPHKHHHHIQSAWAGSCATMACRIAMDMVGSAIQAVMQASLERSSILCGVYEKRGETELADAANYVNLSALRADKSAPKQAVDLLRSLVVANNEHYQRAGNDDARAEACYLLLLKMSKVLALELRVAYDVVIDGFPLSATDASKGESESSVAFLNALIKSQRHKQKVAAAAAESGCPMGYMAAEMMMASEGSTAGTCPFSGRTAEDQPISATVEAGKCPVTGHSAPIPPSSEAGKCPVTGHSAPIPAPAPDDHSAEASTTPSEAHPVESEGANKQARGGEGKKKSALDDPNLTPEQRKAAEAKRRAKEEKAREKALAKAAKKGSGAYLPLGLGSTIVRDFLRNQIFLSTSFSLTNSVMMLQSMMHPLNCGEDSFNYFCSKLMEHLNTSGVRIRPKIAKGARDFGPEEMRVREEAFQTIRKVFKRHGAVEIDTPVFETKELLTGKYGEDSKLIYDLADQGGELLSLRYDLTVPFARYLAMNSVGNIKRFHIGKVYRRDNPNTSKGRFREFYQCDFDVAGNFPMMVADSEVLAVAVEILSELPIGGFTIKLNHRKLLDSIFEICGVASENFRPICSAVDKLDKTPWDLVKKEMVEEKGLTPEVADRIGNYVLFNGKPMELWERLTQEKVFGDHERAREAMHELQVLFGYLQAMDVLDYISFDLSLARGLDYYTGVIYEAVLTDGTTQLGSIAAGGRYDELVGMFTTAGQKIPCVGVSIGVERVFTMMEKRMADAGAKASCSIQVYVACIGENTMIHRMRVAKMLWAANIAAEYSHHESPRLKKQLDEVLSRGVPFMLVMGEDEIKNGTVKVKNVQEHSETEVSLDGLVPYLRSCGL